MSQYLSELVYKIEKSDLTERQQKLAIAFQIEGADQMHHGIDFIVSEITDEFESMTDSERVDVFITDVKENYDAYIENHGHLLEEHDEEVERILERDD